MNSRWIYPFAGIFLIPAVHAAGQFWDEIPLSPSTTRPSEVRDGYWMCGINRSLFTDGIHLTKEGYQAWAKGIAPVIDQFMKAPPLAPVKIMLIGGSATEGLDSSTSYRRYLDGMLRKNGHLIDFVGSRKKQSI